jgi:hypothetical protein
VASRSDLNHGRCPSGSTDAEGRWSARWYRAARESRAGPVKRRPSRKERSIGPRLATHPRESPPIKWRRVATVVGDPMTGPCNRSNTRWPSGTAGWDGPRIGLPACQASSWISLSNRSGPRGRGEGYGADPARGSGQGKHGGSWDATTASVADLTTALETSVR